MSNKPDSLDHGGTPQTHHDDEHPELTARNARSGWWLFAIYLTLYAGFVGLNAFAPQLMGWRPLGGINLAVLYGLGLIVAAVGLALIYMYQCKVAAVAHAAELEMQAGSGANTTDRQTEGRR